jgi:hypothetical protein
MPTDKQLLEDVKRAQEFLRAMFPAPDPANPESMFTTTFGVTFPELDQAVVTPTLFGHEVEGMQVQYRLAFTRRGMVWKAGNILIREVFGLPNANRDFPVPQTEAETQAVLDKRWGR